MKRAFAALAVSALALSACGGNDAASSTTAAPTTTAAWLAILALSCRARFVLVRAWLGSGIAGVCLLSLVLRSGPWSFLAPAAVATGTRLTVAAGLVSAGAVSISRTTLLTTATAALV